MGLSLPNYVPPRDHISPGKRIPEVEQRVILLNSLNITLTGIDCTLAWIALPSDGQTPLRGAGDQYSCSSIVPLLLEEAKICPREEGRQWFVEFAASRSRGRHRAPSLPCPFKRHLS